MGPIRLQIFRCPRGSRGTRCAEIFSARYALASRAGSACVDRLLADDIKQIAIAITCCFALAVLAALALQTVIWQWNLEAQQDQQRIEARRLEQQQEQQRLEARRLDGQQQQWVLEQQRLDAGEVVGVRKAGSFPGTRHGDAHVFRARLAIAI